MCEKQGRLPKPPDDHNEDICISNADGSNIVNLTNTSQIFRELAELGARAERTSRPARELGWVTSR